MRVLMSVSDKSGIVTFAQKLCEMGAEIISTGGTLKALAENGVSVTAVDDVTGFPEMLDGRVKTLHPKIHGGLLAVRDNAEHMATCEAHGIGLIDMVVVNLYPFEATIAKPDVALADAIENIDIGGPSMLRSAAKNYRSVAVVVNPSRYDEIIADMKANSDRPSDDLKASLAAEAFSHTARYDSIIAGYFQDKVLGDSESAFPASISPVLHKVMDLRYGENPHQAAAFYRSDSSGLAAMKQHHGKELSYNNLVDLEAAWNIAKAFEMPAAAVIKHTNPCGAAIADTISQAYRRAHDADPVSAFGSIVALNRVVDVETAQAISETFVEAVVAPSFEGAALAILSKKPSIRLISLPGFQTDQSQWIYRQVTGGFLLQTADTKVLGKDEVTVVTEAQPTARQLEDLLFAFTLVKFVKSNAIVLVKDGQAVGVGAGQMSRVEATEIAIKKAGDSVDGAVLASDAFFPFKDSVEAAISAGVSAIIQPGGSKRDSESIECCNEHGIPMLTTGCRHFMH